MAKKQKKNLASDWITTRELCLKLNISRDTVQRLRDQKIFQNGKHWIDINPYSAPRYRYHLENCKTRLASLREEIETFKN